MKIIDQYITGNTTYYNIEAELDDGSQIFATLVEMDYDDNAIPEHELTIADDSDREITAEEYQELLNLVT